MIDLARGMSDVARGARFVAARPRLWVWVAAPAALALAIIVAIIWGAVAWTGGILAWVGGLLPGFLAGWATGLLTILLVVALLLAGYFVFFSLAALVSAPFNEQLSEVIEEELTGEPAPGFSAARFARDLLLGVAHASKRVLAYAVVMGALLLAGLLVPVIGHAVYVVGGAIVSARFAAYDAFDAVWARKGWRYADKIAYLRAHRARTYGVGGAVALWMLVPGLNLLALSAGAAGATLVFAELRTAPGTPDRRRKGS